MTLPTTRNMQAFLAISCVGSLLSSAAIAQQATPPAEPQALGGMTVSDTAITENEGRRQETPKATRAIRDTPQTITVVTSKVIEQQNLLTLRDVLSTVPGITFGAGEGGGGYGDSINLRGYSANNDITTDGVRDSAQYTRTDPFNIEQIEVTNGANSVYGGSGSVGGSINLVSKRPTARSQTTVTAGIGTDNYYRGTIDANQRVSDLIAVRLNAMVHKNDVPGRDVEDYKRWGIAPSVTFGIETPTRLTLQYLHQKDHNIPQYGVPYYKTANAAGVITNNGPVAGVDDSDYFGYRNLDTQKSTVDQATAVFEHDFTDKVSIRNLTRWQHVTQYSVASAPQGVYCVAATNLTPSGGSCVTAATATVPTFTTPPGYYSPSGPRGSVRDTSNQLGFNQTDLKAVFDTGGIEHTAVLGFAATWEKFNLTSGALPRNPDGTTPALPLISIGNPNNIVPGPAGFIYGSNVYAGPTNFIRSGTQTGETTNYAAYLFDTLKFSDHFELNAGVRYERNSGSFLSHTIVGAARPSTAAETYAYPVGTPLAQGTIIPSTRLYNKDNLFSYRVGAVYKPITEVSLYVAYGNSKTPSKSAVNGSCTSAGVNGAIVSTCNVKPESAKNYEIGAKAEVASGVLLTIAAFRNERDQYRVTSLDVNVPDAQLDGKSRVDGIAVGASGNIRRNWSINANYTYLKSKVLSNVATNGNAFDGQKGNPLTNTPKHSGSLFTTYVFPFRLSVGYGMTYQGSFLLNNTTATPVAAPGVTPATVFFKSNAYVIHNAFLSYEITRAFSAQLNVKNFSNKQYFTRIRNNGWATPGEDRSAILTLTYKL
ncbi:MAG: iron complex outerrane receptor protein [Sphingomonadales bacterium]|nr:iron complex outerrane receptor protein [Sphingomonadales bacterium]